MINEMEKSIYNYPKYYELAFSFRNISKEVDFFENCIERFSRIKVRNVIEIGCGPAPHLTELINRGYNYTGLDRNQKMLKYVEKRAKRLNVKSGIIKGDLRNFTTKKKFDFAFVMLGSLQYILSNDDMLLHFNSLAKCLKHGGIYIIDNVINHHWYKKKLRREWTVVGKDISIDASLEVSKPDTSITQLASANATFKIIDKDRALILSDYERIKVCYPQEFLLLVKLSKTFEYLGSFEEFNIKKPFKDKILGYPRIVSVIRRK